MRIELILLGLIAVVLIVDFILRGIKKKDTTEKGIEKFEGAFEESIKQNKLHYILGRKRNILTFLLIIAFLKPVIHFTFFEELSDEFSIEKIHLGTYEHYQNFHLKDSIGNLYKLDVIGLREAMNLIISSRKMNNAIKIIKDYDNYGFLTKDGNPIYRGQDKNGIDGFNGILYTYKFENLSFSEYLNEKYINKPYIFIISFLVVGFLVFLINDKINAR
jgi:hypothetical protein